MGMTLYLSDDERASIEEYLSTLDTQALTEVGELFGMIEGSDELTRLLVAELGADRELDREWERHEAEADIRPGYETPIPPLDDDPPFPHWKSHGRD